MTVAGLMLLYFPAVTQKKEIQKCFLWIVEIRSSPRAQHKKRAVKGTWTGKGNQ